MDRPEIRDAMDCCRPGSDDVSLPEMAPLAQAMATDPSLGGVLNRIARLDRRIAAATRDVPVPDQIVERLLAKLPISTTVVREASAIQPDLSAAIVASLALADGPSPNAAIAVSAPPALSMPAGPRVSRRMWSLAAVAASAIAISAVATFWRPHTPLSAANLISQSGDWSAQIWQRAAWNALQANGLSKYPLSSAIRAHALAWTDASSIVGENAVAYNVSIGGHRAALFVIPTGDSVADPVPPSQPQSSTNGQMIGCWQANGVVYVLVVEGDARAYENLIRPSAQPPFA